MKFISIAFTAFLISYSSLGQSTECDCGESFEDLINKLEENYIGLAQIRSAGKDRVYEDRKMIFREKVAGISADNCTRFLQQFLSYFQDGHLFAFEAPLFTKSRTDEFKEKIKAEARPLEAILETLRIQQNTPAENPADGLIGEWTDGKSDLVIIKEQGIYKAFVIRSSLGSVSPGELKAELIPTSDGIEGTYYSYEYSPRYVQCDLYKEGTLLVYTGAIYWGKAGDDNNREISMINRENVKLPVIRKLDEANTLFSIPSYMADHQQFNQVILDHLDLLKNTTNLIIDIRGNVGGNALYFSFLDAYATQSMKGSQGKVLASGPTKSYFERYAENSQDVYGPVVERIENNFGKIVDGPAYPDRHFEPFESNIENVAILTDNGCMSAAESFILHSKLSSTKVKTFGQSTGGVIDYTSVNTLKLNSGDQNIYFGYPTSTLHKDIPDKGYNQTGILPDVPIEDEVTDNVGFIIDYYENAE